MRTIPVFFLATVLLATPAVGQQWENYATSNSGQPYYIDTTSVRLEDGYIRYWIKTTIRGGLLERDKTRLMRNATDCATKKVAITAMTETDSSGKVVSQGTRPQSAWEFNEYPPGTMAARGIERACELFAAQKPERQSRLLARLPKSVDWREVNASVDGNMTFSVALITIESVGTGIVKFIGKSEYAAPQKMGTGEQYKYQLGEVVINCDASTFDIQSQESITADFRVVDAWYKTVQELAPKKIPPDSIIESARKATCSQQTPNSNQAGSRPTENTSPEKTSFGSGWIADANTVVTAHHVVAGAKQIIVYGADKKPRLAQVASADASNDVAILKVDFAGSSVKALPFARTQPPLGARVFTLGFPHPDTLGLSTKLTTGEISSVAGLNDDPRFFQISVPTQSGNSGGALLNSAGEVVGIVVSKLNAPALLKATGDLAQNVNYAIKARYIQGLLADLGVNSAPPKNRSAPLEEIVAQAKDSVVLIVTVQQ